MKINPLFKKFAWGTLFYNMLVILWGAYVRATGSGAGCGSHWPFCNGVVIPQSPQLETVIEFIHRVSSGLVVILAIFLFVWAWRETSKKSLMRLSVAGILLFTLTEALVGAGLVLFHLTGTDDSVTRAVVIVIHLLNTFLLLACLALTAWWSTYEEPIGFTWKGVSSWMLLIVILAMVFVGASGAITALGDTLFPATSLAQGLQQDVSTSAHFLIRLRVYHPLLAFALAVFGGLVFRWLREKETNPLTKWLVSGVMVLFGLQLLLGGFNVILLAPTWMQLVHLLVTDFIWTGVVLVFSLNLSRFSRQFISSIIDHHPSQPVTQDVVENI
jgi:cytochrome c oxidase assembly protein subunit 15